MGLFPKGSGFTLIMEECAVVAVYLIFETAMNTRGDNLLVGFNKVEELGTTKEN